MALSLPPGFVRPNAHRGFAVSPDGSQVAYADQAGRLYRQAVGQLDAVLIPGTTTAWYPFFSPDGQWIAYFDQAAARLKKTRLDGSESQVIAEVTGTLRSGGWSTDSTIVFHTSTRPGLWRVRDSGGEPEQVAAGSEVAWLDVLPGGRAVVATSPETDPSGTVVAISLEDGERQRLLPGSTPRFVPPGHLLFQRQGSLWTVRFDADQLTVLGDPEVIVENLAVDAGNIFAHYAVGGGLLLYGEAASAGQEAPVWVRRDGSEELLDSALIQPLSTPSISPDGRRVAFTLTPLGGNLGIWVYNRDQSTFERFSDSDGDFTPFWSADGREVGFSSHRDSPLRFYHALYSRPVDLSAEARLLYRTPGDAMHEAEWTPDGRWLVYRLGSTETTGVADVYYVAPHPDSVPHPFVATSSNEWNPSLSPDGRWLAYTSDESGDGVAQVYVRPFPGPGGRVQVSTDGGTNANWAQNGRELFYMAGRPGSWSMTVATVRTGTTFVVEGRETLYPWPYRPVSGNVANRQWDLSSDAERILTFRTVTDVGEPGRYVVVTNFSEELAGLAAGEP
jgi:serine/threonine-protein kinase